MTLSASLLVTVGLLSALDPDAVIVPDISAGDETLVVLHQGGSLSISLQSPMLRIQEQESIVAPQAALAFPGSWLSGEQQTLRFAPVAIAEGVSAAISVHLTWSLSEQVFRKWAEITVNAPVRLEEVILDAWDADALLETPRFSVPRSIPAFFPGFFVGIEFPVASSRIEEGRLLLGHKPLTSLEPGVVYRSQTAVYGVAMPGREMEAFHRYIEYHRPAPKGLHVNYNSWWTSPVPFSEANILELMGIFEERLYRPYGVALDSFTIDMGWSNPKSIWEIDATLFPEGFSRIQAAAERMGAQLGLWTSPSSYYAPALDPEWAEQQGYETIRQSVPWSEGGVRLLSLGDERYSAHYRDMLVEMVTRFGVRQIKLDGLYQGSGFMAGSHSTEATVAGAVAAFKAARDAAPDVWLECTFDANASPWWLFWLNSVIGSFGDDSPYGRVPCPVYRESYTSARDYYNLQAADRLMSPIAAQEILGVIHQSDEPFLNDAVTTILRGHAFLPLYVNPKFMNDTRWRMLADVLRWARNNEATLVQRPTLPLRPEAWLREGAPWFSHDAPMPRAPYGYAHRTEDTALVMLRNPWIAPQSYKLDLAVLLEPTTTDPLRVVSLYPEPRLYADAVAPDATIDIMLAPYETVVLCLAKDAVTDNLRYAADCIGNQIRVDGCATESIQITFENEAAPFGPDWTDMTGDATGLVEVKAQAQFNASASQARLLVLVEGAAGIPYASGTLTVNDAAVPLQAARSDRGFAASSVPPEEYWLFLEAPLAVGDNAIALEVQAGSDLSDISLWVWATRDSGETHDYPNALPSPEVISLDAVALLTPGAYKAEIREEIRPRRVERIDGVYLDALEAVSEVQGWGTLQKRQSIWERPMTIGGQRYLRGLGVHADSEVVYSLDGKYRVFEAYAGVDGANNGTVTFEVQVDGESRWASGLMTRDDLPHLVRVDITGAATLRLLVGDGGDGISGDHANWADAKLLR